MLENRYELVPCGPCEREVPQTGWWTKVSCVHQHQSIWVHPLYSCGAIVDSTLSMIQTEVLIAKSTLIPASTAPTYGAACTVITMIQNCSLFSANIACLSGWSSARSGGSDLGATRARSCQGVLLTDRALFRSPPRSRPHPGGVPTEVSEQRKNPFLVIADSIGIPSGANVMSWPILFSELPKVLFHCFCGDLIRIALED